MTSTKRQLPYYQYETKNLYAAQNKTTQNESKSSNLRMSDSVKLCSNEYRLYYNTKFTPPLKEVFFTIEAEKPSDIEYSVFYSKQKNILYVFWKGTSDLPLDFTIEIVTKLLDYMKEQQIDSYISISKEHTGRWDSSNDWFYEEGFQMANDAGIRRIASVLSESEYANLSHLISHSKISIKVERKYAYKLFNDIDEAEDWIIKDRMKYKIKRQNT